MPHDTSMTENAAPTFHIRPATAADADFVGSFVDRFAESGALPWRDPTLMVQFHAGRVAEAATQARVPEDGHQVLIAVNEAERLLGFIYLHTQCTVLTGEEQGYVAMLAVTQEAEGSGVGRALLAAGECWAREQGFRHLALDTFGDNLHARAVYEHLGFAEESLKLVKAL